MGEPQSLWKRGLLVQNPRYHSSVSILAEGRHRITRSAVYLVFLGVAVHFLLPQLTTIETAGRLLENLSPAWLTAAMAAQVLSYIASGYLVTSLVQLSGQSVSPARGVLVTLAANTVGTLGAGFIGTAVTSYRWVRGSGVTQEVAALSGWLPPFLNNSVLVALSNWGLVVLILLHELSRTMLVTLIILEIIVAAAMAGLIWALRHLAQVRQQAFRLTQIWARLRRRTNREKMRESINELFDSIGLMVGRNWRRPLAYSALNIAFDLLTLFLLFYAIQRPVSTSVLLAGYALPQLLGKVLMLPGGVGAVETSMVALYATLGVSREIGVIVVLSYRVISFWIPLLLGLVAAPYLERQHVRE